MKKLFYLTIFTIALNGCVSPNATTETKVNSNAATNTTTANTTAANKTDATATETAADANQPYIRGTVINKNTRDQMLAEKGKSDVLPEPIIPTAKVTPYIAPDGSEIAGAMDAKGQMIETRTFRNNPVLAKMERNVTDAENPKIKIYLKNGKVLDVPTGKISNPQTASADEILSAAGLASKTAPKKDAAPNKPKTEDQ